MGSQKRDKALYIDKEALATLALVKEGILSPVDKLMNQNESKSVEQTSSYKGHFFPFPFILAPSGKRNAKVLESLKSGDIVDLVEDGKKCGELKVDEVFKIDRLKRVEQIFATTDASHPGVKDTLRRLGKFAVSGEYEVDTTFVKEIKRLIKKQKELVNAKKVTAIMMAAKPLHRGHERMIRDALEKSDMIVLFLLKPYKKDKFSYELRYEALKYYTDNFLPKNKVLIVPFENTYIFAGYNNVFLDALAAKNFGCDAISVGQNHSGIGLFYDKYGTNSIVDRFDSDEFSIEVSSEYVYCNECKTLVSTKTCPHGTHHHISYKSEFIEELMLQGLLPPAVLVRKEISAIFLSSLYKKRWKKLINKFPDFFPSNGLLEEMDDKKFYLKIIDLHQTASLT
jgi:sulfate adenylyltransferase